MRLVLLVALTMLAFAGNSVLNRIGVSVHGMDPLHFAAIRVAAGAATLALLVVLSGRRLPPFAPRRWAGAAALATYMIGFSWAYLSLPTGIGALILFGVVQLTMFAAAVGQRDAIPPRRWAGAVIAVSGLALLVWPVGPVQVPLAGAAAMALAGAGWAAYTLLGRGTSDPLSGTAVQFLLCLPLVLPFALAGTGVPGIAGTLTAILSGAVTSGLGYALWYRVLPDLAVTTAAVVQLSVPVIATVAGVILLAEPVGLRTALASAIVLAGIALSLRRT